MPTNSNGDEMNFSTVAISFLSPPTPDGKRKAGIEMKKLLSALLALVMLLAPVMALAADCQVGVLYPLSGNVATIGQLDMLAIELAAEIINNEHPELDLPFAAEAGIPGLDGGKLVLSVSDTQGNAEIGQSEAEHLIEEVGVDVIIGAYNSAVTKTASTVAERSEIPFINADSTSVDLTERGYEWFFRTTPHDGTFIEDSFKFLSSLRDEKGLDIQTLALFHEDTEYGAKLRAQIEEQAPAYGFDIVENISYSQNATNLSAEVMKLKETNADVLMCGSYNSDAILLYRTMKEQNWAPKLLLGQRAGFTATETVETVGATDLNDTLSTNLFALDLSVTNPNVQVVNDLFKEYQVEKGFVSDAASGADMNDAYARAFTVVFALAYALDAAGSTENYAVQEALQGLDVANEGQLIVPWSGIRFDESGQNVLAGGIITQLIDGAFVTVYPFESAASEVVYPYTPWSER